MREERPTVVVCGLGPAGAEYLGDALRAAMASAPAYVRTARHLAAGEFLTRGARPLDHCYEGAASFEEAYRRIVEELVTAAEADGRVAYGVPGSPLVLETTVAMLRADPRVRTEVVPNLSFLDLAWSTLGIDPVSASVRLVDGAAFPTDAAGERGPLLVAQLWSPVLLSDLKVAVEEAPKTPVVVLYHLGHPDERVVEVAWEDLDRVVVADHLTSLYVPELAAPVARQLMRAEEVVRVLRERCPWDAAQTHRSLERHLLEEAYEAVEAIGALGEPPRPEGAASLEEELGDVLCQVLFHSRLAAEEGLFALDDVARTLADKLIGRHPHVFQATDAPAAELVLGSWERAKLAEKGRTSVLEGIPDSLPALLYAEKIENKAAAIGLAPPSGGDGEAAAALGELAAGAADAELVGALLLWVAQRCAAAGIEAESALRQAAARRRAEVARAESGEAHGHTC